MTIDNPKSPLNKQEPTLKEHPLQAQLDEIKETLCQMSKLMKLQSDAFNQWKDECDLRARAGKFGGPKMKAGGDPNAIQG